jgi:hypothetical protein
MTRTLTESYAQNVGQDTACSKKCVREIRDGRPIHMAGGRDGIHDQIQQQHACGEGAFQLVDK